MTSKISFLKLMREDLKRRGWMVALLAVVFFLMYPVGMMLSLDSMLSLNPSGMPNYTSTEIKEWLLSFWGFGNALHMLLVIMAAALIGTAEFSYLHSREKLDLYHSLPLRRKTLFMSGYLTGILIFAAVFAVCQILCLFIALIKGVLFAEVLHMAVKAAVFRMISFLFLYQIAIFAMQFTGKTVLAVLGMIVLNVYGPACLLLVGTLVEIGFYTAVNLDFVGIYRNLSPVWIVSSMESCIYMNQPYMTQVVIIVVGILGVFAIDLWLCEYRATEHAGMALAFPKMEQILKFLLVLPGAMLVGLVAYSVTNEGNIWWIFAGFLFGVIVLSVLMEFIYHKDMKMILRHKLGLGITLVTGVLILSSFLFDWFGYNVYLPKKEEIQEMSICGGGGLGSSVSEEQYVEGERGIIEYISLYDRMQKTGTEEFDQIYDFAQFCVENGKESEEPWDYVTVCVRKKNGREVYRQYSVPNEKFLELEKQLYKEKWYQEMCYPLLGGTAEEWQEKVWNVECIDENGNSYGFEKNEAKELMDIYRRELSKLSSTEIEIYEATYGESESGAEIVPETVEAEETIQKEEPDQEISYDYIQFTVKDERVTLRHLYGYPLNKNFKETLNWIKKHTNTEENE